MITMVGKIGELGIILCFTSLFLGILVTYWVTVAINI